MVKTIVDVTAVTGTPVPLQASGTSVKACWIQIQSASGNASARVGDAAITSTRGGLLAAGGDYQFIPTAGNANLYDLNAIYILGTTGNTFPVVYGVD